MKKYFAEILGTFALVFAGTGAIVINDFSGGTITHVGIALTFGLIVLAMIYTVGDISGAHLNPAVTIGFWAARRMSGREVLPYIAGQLSEQSLPAACSGFYFPKTNCSARRCPPVRKCNRSFSKPCLHFF